MLRYKTQTRPGLVTLYDIRAGNGAGLFLQPRSLHGAMMTIMTMMANRDIKKYAALGCGTRKVGRCET